MREIVSKVGNLMVSKFELIFLTTAFLLGHLYVIIFSQMTLSERLLQILSLISARRSFFVLLSLSKRKKF